MTKPGDVYSAMISAVLDADAEYAENNNGLACPANMLVKAALGAARELGYEIVPKYLSEDFEAKINPKYRQAVVEGYRLAVLCAPDILAEGE